MATDLRIAVPFPNLGAPTPTSESGSGIAAPLPQPTCADSAWAPSPFESSYGSDTLDQVARAVARAHDRALEPFERAQRCPSPVGAACRVWFLDSTTSGRLVIQSQPAGSSPPAPRPLFTYAS